MAHDPLDAEALARRVAELVARDTRPRLLTAKEVGEMLGVPASWVMVEARADRIPHVRLGARYVRFDPAAVTAWWRTRERGPRTRTGTGPVTQPEEAT